MDLKNLMSHVVRPVNPTTTGELPAPEVAQLSEEDLQQIIGGKWIWEELDLAKVSDLGRRPTRPVTR
jgi:bacteriocin-like protein